MIPSISSSEIKTEDFYEDFVAPLRPVVIRGEANELGRFSQLDPDDLESMIGDRKVLVSFQERGCFDLNDVMVDEEPESEELPLSEAKRLIEEDGRYYLSEKLLGAGWLTKFYLTVAGQSLDLSSELTDGLELPRLLGNPSHWRGHLWFGGEKCLTPLHHDHQNNLFFQIHGEKQFILHAPFQKDGLYQAQKEKFPYCSRVDVFNPDYSAFPKYEDLKRWEITVRAGDMLYIPKRWWHAVDSRSVSISVNFWWSPLKNEITNLLANGHPRKDACWMCDEYVFS